MSEMVGAGVSRPVVVDATVVRDAAGELAREGNRVPDIVALDARRWIVCWRSGLPDPHDRTPTDQGAIRFAVTADGGATWRKGTLAAATDTHRYHYAMLFTEGSFVYALLGRITVAEDREESEVDGFPVHLTLKRSPDGGATWADQPITVDVPPNTRGVVVAGKPVKVGEVWTVPFWRQGAGASQAAVLRSTDLKTWKAGALAPNPPGVGVEEPQIGLRPDGTLVMVTRALVRRARPEDREPHYRVSAAHCATTTSTDGGLTWAPMRLHPDLPNYYVKTFFMIDSTGREIALYNTFAGPIREPRPDRFREVLHYKVADRGEPWQPGRLFADGPRLTRTTARGWDVYPSAAEISPGVLAVVWEHNQIEIKVARLTLTTPLPKDLAPGRWTLDAGATLGSDGGLRLRSTTAKAVGARRPLAEMCDFTVEFHGQVVDDSALDPATGQGVCLGTKVCNGARRLMLTVQKGGVWTMRKGSSTWERILATSSGPAVWKVVTDSAGVARLFRDGADTGVTWVIQDSGETPQLSHWVMGTRGGNTAEARIDWTRLTPTIDENPA
ncbi:sialidase family protein [Herbidospora daliensis]|uniref:sialidase family protein n=1 Tax=Herbidospora daliensis TaxID=295585 RepID=UPI0009FEA9F9|nr:sialidase family protein [Herbidospora daliensis]